MSLPAPLMFTVGLIDQITKPIAKISQAFNGLADNYQAGTLQLATGAAGVAASAVGIHQAMMPAIEMDRALGDIKGLGVANDGLKQLSQTAINFATDYGKSALEVLRHGEKLRQSLGDMPAHVLASSAESSAILAMVMKSDVDTTAKYIKNLYGNNQAMADAMGRDKFVAQVTGMTAQIKKLYGTEMSELEGMIDGMHSLTSTMQVPLEEQFAVLAMLGKQMGQGDAVTQYTNFLENVQGAQDKLGVTLTDSHGKLLPMVQMLERLKPLLAGKSQAASWQLLDEAGLGDGSLAIINMINNLDSFKASMASMASVSGLGPAMDMAKAMTDQTERLNQSWYVIRAAFGSAILPAFNGFMGKLAGMGKSVIWFTEMFPNLTRILGYTALGIMGLVVAGGLLTLGVGLWSMAMTAWGAATMTASAIGAGFTAALTWMRGAILAVNLAMAMNPIGLLVAGIAAAVVAVGALIYYWDDLKASMGEWGWLSAIVGVFNTVWASVRAVISDSMDWIIDKLNLIPGVEIDAGMSAPSIEALAPVKPNLPQGGVTRQIANANNRSTNVGTVNVYPKTASEFKMTDLEMYG